MLLFNASKFLNCFSTLLQAVGAKTKLRVEALKNLFNTEGNSKNFRKQLESIIPPCIPHLGMMAFFLLLPIVSHNTKSMSGLFLADLTFIDDGNSDMTMHLINFNKMALLAGRIGWIRQYQQISYGNETKLRKGVMEMMERNIEALDDEVLWSLSQTAEPRLKK